jgi:hypothetical protein
MAQVQKRTKCIECKKILTKREEALTQADFKKCLDCITVQKFNIFAHQAKRKPRK